MLDRLLNIVASIAWFVYMLWDAQDKQEIIWLYAFFFMIGFKLNNLFESLSE